MYIRRINQINRIDLARSTSLKSQRSCTWRNGCSYLCDSSSGSLSSMRAFKNWLIRFTAARHSHPDNTPCCTLRRIGRLRRDRYRPRNATWAAFPFGSLLWYPHQPGVLPFGHVARLSILLRFRHRLHLLLAHPAHLRPGQYRVAFMRRMVCPTRPVGRAT